MDFTRHFSIYHWIHILMLRKLGTCSSKSEPKVPLSHARGIKRYSDQSVSLSVCLPWAHSSTMAMVTIGYYRTLIGNYMLEVEPVVSVAVADSKAFAGWLLRLTATRPQAISFCCAIPCSSLCLSWWPVSASCRATISLNSTEAVSS